MNLARIEKALGMRFPERHSQALVDAGDRIHDKCDFLLPYRTDKMRTILEENKRLHSPQQGDPWPRYLVAFASNGFGDFFAYDLRGRPYRVIYIDPDRTVRENLESDDRLTFGNFEAWYDHEVT